MMHNGHSQERSINWFDFQKEYTEKLGAKPNGISEFLLHGKEHLEQWEDENLHLLDEKLITLAEQFQVEPRKLLSHVLEYKLIYDG